MTASLLDTLVIEIIAIAETLDDETSRNREAMNLAHRLAVEHPDMVGYMADDLLAAAASERHAPRSEKLLAEVGAMLSRMYATRNSNERQ